MKNFDITGRVTSTIGAGAFNILNHPHFADPESNVASGGLGGIYGTVEEPLTGRVMGLTAKFKF